MLRLCSVFEAPKASLARSRTFDVVGGMQVHTARLTAALDDLGIDQTVISAFRPGAPRSERIGRRATVVRVGLPTRSLRQLYGVASIPEILRPGRPDVVHAHVGEDLAIAPLARWAAARAGAPIVVTVHCSLRNTVVPHDLRSAIFRAVGGPIQDRLLRAAGMVLVLTQPTAELLAGAGVPPERIRVVPLGIDLDASDRAPRPAVMDHRPWVVYAGRLVREKGVRDLVEAIGRLPGVGLLVVGDGPDRPALEEAAARFGMADRIRFVGAVGNADVQPFLRHADVVVLPSWFEERGRVLVEAMAAGTAVIAARSAGAPETVRDGVDGLVVPPRAPEALAAAIERLLADERLAATLSAGGRTTAATQPLSALTSETLDAYRTVLAERGPDPALVVRSGVTAP